MKDKKFIVLALFLAIGLTASLPVSAAERERGRPNDDKPGFMRGLGQRFGERQEIKPVLVGKVTAISGTTLTVSGRPGPGQDDFVGSSTPITTFTVDARNAKITKNKATSTVSVIAVGDTVLVQGMISGTNVVATAIHDGAAQGQMEKERKGPRGTSTPSIISGNGQPVIAGKVSAISGASLTLTNKSNIVYTVDASNAKVYRGQKTAITLADVKVGDNLIVQGTVSGTSIIASTVIDKPVNLDNSGQPKKAGFLGGVGRFFGRIFGF